MKIPPGVSASDFAEAIKQFEEAVGKEWVFTSDEDVALYRDAYSPFWGEANELVASAAVAPDNVEQVQKVVRIANQYKIPIYPVSTGKDLGYGGSAPTYSGSVVLDLKRMNRILEVNEPNAYALVEPGVSYFDLYRYIQEEGNQAVGGRSRSRLGQPDWQFARSWRRLFAAAISQPLRFALRDGSRAREWRSDAHRNGRDAGSENLAGIQVGVRTLDRWDVFAVQFRRDDENGILDVPRAGLVSRWARSRCRGTAISFR